MHKNRHRVLPRIQTFVLTLLALLIVSTPAISFAQKNKDEKETTDSPAAKIMKQIDQHIQESEWAQVAGLMTEDAWDNWCTQLVFSSKSLTETDFGFAPEEMTESIEGIREVLEKYELIEPKDAEKEGEEKKEPEFSSEVEVDINMKDAEKKKASILKSLGDGEKRLEIVDAIWKAQEDSPFGFNLFKGKIKEELSAEGDQSISVKVEPHLGPSSSDGAIEFVIMAPPMWFNLNKVDDEWKFAGLDEEKSAKEAENFQPEMGSEPHNDF